MILLASVVLILVAILIFTSLTTEEEVTEEGLSVFPLGGSRDLKTEEQRDLDSSLSEYETVGDRETEITPPSLPFFSQSVINPSELPRKRDYSSIMPSLLAPPKRTYLGYVEGSGISEQAYFNMQFPEPFRDYLSKIQDELVIMGFLEEEDQLSFQSKDEIILFLMATLEKHPEYLLDYRTFMPEEKTLPESLLNYEAPTSEELGIATTTEE